MKTETDRQSGRNEMQAGVSKGLIRLFERNTIRGSRPEAPPLRQPSGFRDQESGTTLPMPVAPATLVLDRPSLDEAKPAAALPEPETAPAAPKPDPLQNWGELYLKYKKLQLHYSACQILLKVGVELNAQLQEIARLLVERFSLWQCNIFLLEESEEPDLVCCANASSRTRRQLETQFDWIIRVGHETPLGKVIQDKKEVFLQEEEYHRYCFPISHQKDVQGVFDLFYSPAHMLTVEEQLSMKTVAAQLSSYLEEYKKYQAAQQMAITDGLTHLYNHRYFQEQLEDSIKNAHLNEEWLSVILLDIDHFKQINDLHGHLQGDKVLRHVAQVLRQTLRRCDIPARYGGEEYAVLLRNTDLKIAEQIAERIRQNIERAEVKGSFSTPVKITASLGIAGLKAPALSQREDLLAMADSALYEVKENGRNHVRVFNLDALTHQIRSLGEERSHHPYDWAEQIRQQEAGILEEWQRLTKNYDVVEVTLAVELLKPSLPVMLAILADYLESRRFPEMGAASAPPEILPRKQFRKWLEENPTITVLSFEMAGMFLQEALKVSVAGAGFPGEEQALIFSAIDQLIDQFNQNLLRLSKKEKKPESGAGGN